MSRPQTRSHAAKLAARNTKYRRQGFSSYSQARRLGHGSATKAGVVDNRADLERLPATALDRREDASRVLAKARRDGLSLRDAAHSLGMPGADRSIPFYFPGAVTKSPDGLWPTARDRAFRAMSIRDDKGREIEVDTFDSETASLIGRHLATLHEVAEGRLPPSALREFEGVEVDGHRLLTDPRRVRALARQGRLIGGPYPSRGGG